MRRRAAYFDVGSVRFIDPRDRVLALAVIIIIIVVAPSHALVVLTVSHDSPVRLIPSYGGMPPHRSLDLSNIGRFQPVGLLQVLDFSKFWTTPSLDFSDLQPHGCGKILPHVTPAGAKHDRGAAFRKVKGCIAKQRPLCRSLFCGVAHLSSCA